VILFNIALFGLLRFLHLKKIWMKTIQANSALALAPANDCNKNILSLLNDFGNIKALIFPLTHKTNEMPFELNSEKVQKIKELNDKIRQEELKLRQQYFILEKQLNELVQQQFMDDFNIDFQISVFSYDDAFNQKHKVETGDSFYESSVLSPYYFEDEEMFFENWNETHSKIETLAQMYFCYTMHDITSHSHLSWEDILAIDDVWLEINVDYQFWTKKK